MINLVGKIQLAIGTTAERLSVVPLMAEPVWDTDTKKLYIGDGTTAGGVLVDNDTDAEVAALVQALADEVEAREDADIALNSAIGVVQSNLNTEASLRSSADITLQTNINNVINDLDDHENDLANPHQVTAAQVGLDQVDNTSDVNKPISVAAQAAFDAEATARADGDQALETLINDSVSDLNADISAEQSARVAADDILQDNIDVLTSDLSTEVTDRTAADTALQGQITTNAGNIATNTADISTVTAGLATEITDRKLAIIFVNNNIASVASDLSDETADRIAADTALDGDITNLENAISNEISDRSNADITLQDNIDTEAAARIAGDLSNYNDNLATNVDLAAEVINRENADIALQSNVDSVDGVVTAHIADTANPHSVTKTQVGLGNVDNTSDINKPISTATQSALDLKANSADLATVATTGSYNDLIDKPSVVGQVNSDWNATSGVEEILNKPTTLSGYGITDAINSSEKGATNGVATLVSGKVPTSQLPSLVVTETFVVSSQAAQLALTVEQGDIAVRTDLSKSYIQNGGSTGTMSDWTELLSPTAGVSSVNGQTGAVVLDATDIGLGNVDNTSDINKPISTATQSALNLKQDSFISETANKVFASPVSSTGGPSFRALAAQDIPSLTSTYAVVGRRVDAGTGLTGGGDFVTNITISLNSGSIASLALADSAVQPGALAPVATSGTFASLTSKPTTIAGYGIVDALSTTRLVSTGTGLTGGGDLSADRTLALSAGSIASLALADSALQPGGVAFSSLTGIPTTLSGYGITDAQAIDAGLTSIAGLTTSAGTSIYTTALDTYATYATSTAGRALSNVAGTTGNAPYLSGTDTWSLSAVTTGGRALWNVAGTSGTVPYFSAANVVTLQATSAGGRALWNATGTANTTPYFSAANTVSVQATTAGGRALWNVAGTSGTFPYYSAANTVTLGTISANSISLLASANYAAMRTNLGLVIGTNVQAYNANLTSWAALDPSAKANSAQLINAGVGMTGGGDLSADRTLTLGTPSTLDNTTTNSVTGTTHTHAITGFLPLTGGTLTGSVVISDGSTVALDLIVGIPTARRLRLVNDANATYVQAAGVGTNTGGKMVLGGYLGNTLNTLTFTSTYSSFSGEVLAPIPVVLQHGSTTLGPGHLNAIVRKTNTTAYTYTIGTALGRDGDAITIANHGSTADITIVGSSVTLYKNGTSGSITVAPHTSVTLIRESSTVWSA